MKMIVAVVALSISACAALSRDVGASDDAFAGEWRGALAKGDVRSFAELHFKRTQGGYDGFWWGRSLMPIPLDHVQLGPEVHFEVPDLGTFDGKAQGDTIAGTFRDGTGAGSFRLEKQPDWPTLSDAP